MLDLIPGVEATREELQEFIRVVESDIAADSVAVWKAHDGVPADSAPAFHIIKRFGSWKRIPGLTIVQVKIIVAFESACRKAFTF